MRGLNFAAAIALAAACSASADVEIGNVTPLEAKAKIGELRSGGERGRIVVNLKPGRYYLAWPLKFTAADSDVVWRGNGAVTLSRAVEVTGAEQGEDGVFSAPFSCNAPEAPDSQCFGRIRSYAPLFFFDDEMGTPARWPNEGFAEVEEILGAGHARPFKLRGAAAGPFKQGAFTVATDRPAKWDYSDRVMLSGYWTHDWADEHVRIDSFDAEKKLFTVSTNSFICYGIGGDETWSDLKRRFYAYHVRAELDAPGEWFFDRRGQKVDFIPPRAGAKLYGAPKGGPIVQADGLSRTRFEGIRFSGSAEDGLVFTNCTDVAVVDSFVACCGNSGVIVTDGARVSVENCEIRTIGIHGVDLVGGDKLHLVEAGHAVRNCRIHDFGRVRRTLSLGVHVLGCGNRVIGNEIWDAPHTAILYGGCEHRIISNELHHVLKETGDAGVIYTGRDPTSCGNVVAFNHIHDITKSGKSNNTMGIYLDDCDCGDDIVSNVIERVAVGMMLCGGQANRVIGNVFRDCNVGINYDARGLVWKSFDTMPEDNWMMSDKVRALGAELPKWQARYPFLKTYLDDPKPPRFNPVHGNRFVGCTEHLILFVMFPDEALKWLDLKGNSYESSVGRPTALPDVRARRGILPARAKPCADPEPVVDDVVSSPAVWSSDDGTLVCASSGRETLWLGSADGAWEKSDLPLFKDGIAATMAKLGGDGFRAPCVFRKGRHYAMFFEVQKELATLGIAVAFAERAEGPFVSPRMVLAADAAGGDATAPFVVRDDDSRRVWMFFGCENGVRRIELDSRTLKVKAGAQAVRVAGLSTREEPKGNCANGWRQKVFIKPVVFNANGWWYLVAGAGEQGSPHARIVYGRSAKADGEFVCREGGKLVEGWSSTLLASSPTGVWNGPSEPLGIFYHDRGLYGAKLGVSLYYTAHARPAVVDAWDSSVERSLYRVQLGVTSDGWLFADR